MTRYMILFRAAKFSFPNRPKQLLRLWEGLLAGASQLFKFGMKALGWFSPREEYAMVEAESKAKLLELVGAFFPLYTREIHEIASFDAAKEALLTSARTSAGSM